jgi:hypothetical protein
VVRTSVQLRLCEEVGQTIEFGGKVWPDEAAVYKYALDVDGNGWSSRFHRLLSSGSPVLKMTMFPEWNMVSAAVWRWFASASALPRLETLLTLLRTC